MLGQSINQDQDNSFFYRTEGDNHVHSLTNKQLSDKKIFTLADFKKFYQDNVMNSQQDLMFILHYKPRIELYQINMLTTSEKEPLIVATKCLNFRMKDEIDDYFFPEGDLQSFGIKRLFELENYFQFHINQDKEPLDFVFQGKTQKKETPLTSFQTTRNQPIWVGRKYIKNVMNEVSKNYFLDRGIKFTDDIVLQEKFEPILRMIQNKGYEVSQEDFISIKNTYGKTNLESESDIKPVVTAFLHGAYTLTEAKILRGRFEIKVREDGHAAFVDHIFEDLAHKKIIILCEDKHQDLEKAKLQNFDQLMSFSLTEAGMNQKYFYGIASTVSNWVFCCYIRPEQEKAATKHNFIVSKNMPLTFDDQNLPRLEFVKDLVQLIRGLMTNNPDQVMDQHYTSH